MRKGVNPNKSEVVGQSSFFHQVIIPVYIPNEEGYFKDSLMILKCCLNSLFATSHDKTFVSIVNNGSSQKVVEYLNELLAQDKIHELIHTDNCGKVNAVLKALVGHNIQVVTLSDSDVKFLPGWQNATIQLFNEFPKVGVVGLTPQIKMFKNYCGNVLWDNLFKKSMQFLPIPDPNAMQHFYDSIGWGQSFNPDYLKYGLGISKHGVNCFVGSGHYVATYRREIFSELNSFIPGNKVAGKGEDYIDSKALDKDMWRVTTYENYALHMGNIYEKWMSSSVKEEQSDSVIEFQNKFQKDLKTTIKFYQKIKNRGVIKLLKIRFFEKCFYRIQGLPLSVLKNY